MSLHIYTIRCISNLHAGSGDAGYGVVDKLVQRDPVTNHPTIHASGLKGALREHFSKEPFVAEIFGDEAKPGSHNFFAADMLAMPVADHSAAAHYKLVHDANYVGALEAKYKDLSGKAIGLVSFAGTSDSPKFKEASAELPVIARNSLENGKSVNLWYEEVVPRESVFVVAVMVPASENVLNLNQKVIQIGGNATIGYGFCLFTKIN